MELIQGLLDEGSGNVALDIPPRPSAEPSSGLAGHSMTVLAMAGGSRPASSHPAAVAASGTPMTARTR